MKFSENKEDRINENKTKFWNWVFLLCPKDFGVRRAAQGNFAHRVLA